MSSVSVERPEKMVAVFESLVANTVPFILFVDGERLKGWGGPDLGDAPVTLAFDEGTYAAIARQPDGVFEAMEDHLYVLLSFDRTYRCCVPYSAMVQISIMPAIPDATAPVRAHLRLVPFGNRGEA